MKGDSKSAYKLLCRFEGLIESVNTLNQTVKDLGQLGRIRYKPLFSNYNSCVDEFKSTYPTEFQSLKLEDLPLYDAEGKEQFTGDKLSTLLHQTKQVRDILKGLSASHEDEVVLPEKVSLAWLWQNVPIKFWGWLIGLLAAAFLLGISFGQIQWVRDLMGVKHKPIPSQQMVHNSKRDTDQSQFNTVHSSNIEVNLHILVGQEVRPFNGIIASRSERCFLETKSGEKVVFTSIPGTTRMIRSGRQYQFSFNAHLPQGHNVFRSVPQEFLGAREAIIPLNPFVSLIKKKLPKESALMLEFIEVSFYVNGKRVSKSRYSEKKQISIDSSISVPLKNV